MLNDLPPWEQLLKKILWKQLGDIQGQCILDFGSGSGITACHYAKENDVTAVEPDESSVENRRKEYGYRQLVGSTEILKSFEDHTFDIIFCHNVLEYALDREEILREFYRILKPGGTVSIVKHNRAGRVMQMVVLLNEFEKAHDLLDGKDGTASQYGTIHYYEDQDLLKWCDGFHISDVHGIRTFWDLQQNQQIHRDIQWQEKMVEAEMRVADIEDYRNIAFFHHVILKK